MIHRIDRKINIEKENDIQSFIEKYCTIMTRIGIMKQQNVM